MLSSSMSSLNELSARMSRSRPASSPMTSATMQAIVATISSLPVGTMAVVLAALPDGADNDLSVLCRVDPPVADQRPGAVDAVDHEVLGPTRQPGPRRLGRRLLDGPCPGQPAVAVGPGAQPPLGGGQGQRL